MRSGPVMSRRTMRGSERMSRSRLSTRLDLLLFVFPFFSLWLPSFTSSLHTCFPLLCLATSLLLVFLSPRSPPFLPHLAVFLLSQRPFVFDLRFVLSLSLFLDFFLFFARVTTIPHLRILIKTSVVYDSPSRSKKAEREERSTCIDPPLTP